MFSFYQSYESTNLIGEAQNVCDAAAIKHKDIEIIQLIVSELGCVASERGTHKHTFHPLFTLYKFLVVVSYTSACSTHTNTHAYYTSTFATASHRTQSVQK